MSVRAILCLFLSCGTGVTLGKIVDPNAHLFERMIPVFEQEEHRKHNPEQLHGIGQEPSWTAKEAVEKIESLVGRNILKEDQARSLISMLARAEHAKKVAESFNRLHPDHVPRKSG